MPKRKRTFMTDQKKGETVLAAYISAAEVRKPDQKEDYIITDCIVALMKHARQCGHDAKAIHESAMEHFTIETEGTGEHTQDSQCEIDPANGCCYVCEVEHGPECPSCGQRAFHLATCAAVVAE